VEKKPETKPVKEDKLESKVEAKPDKGVGKGEKVKVDAKKDDEGWIPGSLRSPFTPLINWLG
jgi:hypothetical protein